jgi:hypothetical protein
MHAVALFCMPAVEIMNFKNLLNLMLNCGENSRLTKDNVLMRKAINGE